MFAAVRKRKNWRRGGDSNSRYTCAYFAFRVRRDRPLCHLSALGRGGSLAEVWASANPFSGLELTEVCEVIEAAWNDGRSPKALFCEELFYGL
jgi:hypothetical protein